MGDLLARAKAFDNAKYLGTPLARYIHSSNKEAAVSSIDFDTDTFTSVEHPFTNGQLVSPIMNYDAGKVYPMSLYPNGITYSDAGYYVVNAGVDTFQLSATLGGIAIDLTDKATMDLTKWHFESYSSSTTIMLPETVGKCKVVVKGKCLNIKSYFYCLPTAVPVNGAEWAVFNDGSAENVYDNPPLLSQGDIAVDVTILIDYSEYLSLKVSGVSVKSSSGVALNVVPINRFFITPLYRQGTFNSIVFTSCHFSNGTVIEVYKL